MSGQHPRDLRGEMAQAEEAGRPRKPWRDSLYGRIKVSVATMDKIIIGLVALLVAALLLGLVTGGQ